MRPQGFHAAAVVGELEADAVIDVLPAWGAWRIPWLHCLGSALGCGRTGEQQKRGRGNKCAFPFAAAQPVMSFVPSGLNAIERTPLRVLDGRGEGLAGGRVPIQARRVVDGDPVASVAPSGLKMAAVIAPAVAVEHDPAAGPLLGKQLEDERRGRVVGGLQAQAFGHAPALASTRLPSSASLKPMPVIDVRLRGERGRIPWLHCRGSALGCGRTGEQQKRGRGNKCAIPFCGCSRGPGTAGLAGSCASWARSKPASRR